MSGNKKSLKPFFTLLRMSCSLQDPQGQGKDLSLQLLQVILAVSSVPAQYPVNEQISEMPFGFWYIFQDDIIACEPPQYEHCIVSVLFQQKFT